MANLEVGTLYDCKNQTNSYDFLQIARVHALLLSVSFKPTYYIDFTLVIDMLARSLLFFVAIVKQNKKKNVLLFSNLP